MSSATDVGRGRSTADGARAPAVGEDLSTHASLASMKAITAARIGSGSVWYSAASMPHRHMRRPRMTSA